MSSSSSLFVAVENKPRSWRAAWSAPLADRSSVHSAEPAGSRQMWVSDFYETSDPEYDIPDAGVIDERAQW